MMNDKMGKEYTESEEYFEKYPPADKQYLSVDDYSTYESLQTGAMGKSAQ